ncbi:MAG: IPT/TIG domain-containing protein [Candidatus Margulisiibacteriota bacterium]
MTPPTGAVSESNPIYIQVRSPQRANFNDIVAEAISSIGTDPVPSELASFRSWLQATATPRVRQMMGRLEQDQTAFTQYNITFDHEVAAACGNRERAKFDNIIAASIKAIEDMGTSAPRELRNFAGWLRSTATPRVRQMVAQLESNSRLEQYSSTFDDVVLKACGWERYQLPSISAMAPATVRQGETKEITLTGANFNFPDEPTITFANGSTPVSIPVSNIRVSEDKRTVTFSIAVPANTTPGNLTVKIASTAHADQLSATAPNPLAVTPSLPDRPAQTPVRPRTTGNTGNQIPGWRRYIGTEDTPGMVNPRLRLSLGTVPGDDAPVTLGSYSNFGLAPAVLVRVVGPNGIIESPRLEVVAPLQATFATDFDGNRLTDAGAGVGVRYAFFRGLQPGAYVLASGRKTHAEESTRQFPTGDATNATFGLASSGFIGDRASYGAFVEHDRTAFSLNHIEVYGGSYDGTRRTVRAGGQFAFNPVGDLSLTLSYAQVVWGEQSTPDTLAGEDYKERVGAQAVGLTGAFPNHRWHPYAQLNIGRETLGDGDYAWNAVALTDVSIGALFPWGRPEIWAGHIAPNHYVDESRNFLQASYFPEFGESLPFLAPLGAHLQIADNGGGVTGMLTYDLVRGATALFFGREVYKGQSRVGPYSSPLLPMGTPIRYLTPNSALPSFQRPLNVRGASVPAAGSATVSVGTESEKKSH